MSERDAPAVHAASAADRAAPPGGLRDFARSEFVGLGRTFGRAAVRVGLATGVLAALYFVAGATTRPSAADGPPRDPVVMAVAVVVLSLVYAVQAGLLAGAASAVYRLFGAWVIVPALLGPLAVLATFWLARHWLAGEGMDVLRALVAAGRHHGMAHTSGVLAGARVGHAGGPAALIILVLLLPFLLADALGVLFAPSVLWQFAQFLGLAALVAGGALALALLVSLPPLLYALATRLRARHRAFRANAGR